MEAEDHVTIERATGRFGPGPWWFAHDHPERPPDAWCVWDRGCPACVLHLRAAARRSPDMPGTSGGPFELRRRWTLAEAVAQLDEGAS